MTPRSTLAFVSTLVCAIAIGCGSYRPPAVAFDGHPPSSAAWPAIFAKAPRATLETFETGRIRVRRSDVIDLDDPRARDLKEEELFVPVYAHLFRHEERGDYLIDAGLDRSFQKTTSGDMKGLFAFKVYALQRPGEDIASRLQERGANLRGVFFTHLHPDHLSGAASLPRDVRYVVGKSEKPTSVGFLFWEDALKDVGRLEEIDFGNAPTIPPLGRCADVFGDGSLWAISTPGHTTGHLSFVAITKTGPTLLTGDASHLRWGFEHGVAPGKFNDGTKEDSRQSLDQLIAFARAYPEVKVIFGHSL